MSICIYINNFRIWDLFNYLNCLQRRKFLTDHHIILASCHSECLLSRGLPHAKAINKSQMPTCIGCIFLKASHRVQTSKHLFHYFPGDHCFSWQDPPRPPEPLRIAIIYNGTLSGTESATTLQAHLGGKKGGKTRFHCGLYLSWCSAKFAAPHNLHSWFLAAQHLSIFQYSNVWQVFSCHLFPFMFLFVFSAPTGAGLPKQMLIAYLLSLSLFNLLTDHFLFRALQHSVSHLLP